MNGTHYLITDEQRVNTEFRIEKGQKFIRIGSSTIPVHQIVGIDPLKQYIRKTNMALAQKWLKMCRHCGTIVPKADKCPCKEKPKDYPSLLEQAKEENPKLAEELLMLAERTEKRIRIDKEKVKSKTTATQLSSCFGSSHSEEAIVVKSLDDIPF